MLNIARLEHYVALAFEADIDTVIILTKADLLEDPAPYVKAAQAISDRVPVIAMDARSDKPAWARTTESIRENGAKGWRTTTRRKLHVPPSGCLLLDKPSVTTLHRVNKVTGKLRLVLHS